MGVRVSERLDIVDVLEACVRLVVGAVVDDNDPDGREVSPLPMVV